MKHYSEVHSCTPPASMFSTGVVDEPEENQEQREELDAVLERVREEIDEAGRRQ